MTQELNAAITVFYAHVSPGPQILMAKMLLNA